MFDLGSVAGDAKGSASTAPLVHPSTGLAGGATSHRPPHEPQTGEATSASPAAPSTGEAEREIDDVLHQMKENTGRWTIEEHNMFLEGLKIHGKGWKQIALMIKTRTVVQIRTHAQKYFQKLAKAQQNGNASGDVAMDTRGGPSSVVSLAGKGAGAPASSASSMTGGSSSKNTTGARGAGKPKKAKKKGAKRKASALVESDASVTVTPSSSAANSPEFGSSLLDGSLQSLDAAKASKCLPRLDLDKVIKSKGMGSPSPNSIMDLGLALPGDGSGPFGPHGWYTRDAGGVDVDSLLGDADSLDCDWLAVDKAAGPSTHPAIPLDSHSDLSSCASEFSSSGSDSEKTIDDFVDESIAKRRRDDVHAPCVVPHPDLDASLELMDHVFTGNLDEDAFVSALLVEGEHAGMWS